MIAPVTFSTVPSAVPQRPLSDEVLKRALDPGKGARAPSEAGESRVDISPEGAAQAQAEARAVQPPTAAPANAAEAPVPTPSAEASVPEMLRARPGLSFSKADANEDGVVSLPEEHAYETRHLQRTAEPEAPAGPGAAAQSEPIRTYRSVEATMASI
ncbi:hypothetical protein RA210_U30194 [Rubrivivax sp. A210]|uniref:hypothetical protein n=1 Tax=Rubrivivax sp. A210 TaxID=2772301 RepID=UPI00191ACBB9|nr:hypothetical protein [Rubrivivax sp. A210]CAD5373282.1 hypothetical protein RA210_U30194 [Rubrivivax sp. A210]